MPSRFLKIEFEWFNWFGCDWSCNQAISYDWIDECNRFVVSEWVSPLWLIR